MLLFQLILVLQLTTSAQISHFPSEGMRIVSVTDTSSSVTVQISHEEAARLKGILASGKRDPAVFMAEYVIHVNVKRHSTAIGVNRNRFKYNGKTYIADEDIGKTLSALFANH